MIFSIRRASNIFSKEPPCEGAFLHDIEWKEWRIDVKTLEDLMALSEAANCRLIVDRKTERTDVPAIWIYDDYME